MTQSANSPQILLDIEQYETLQQIAQAKGSSVVAVVQEVMQLGIESLQNQKQQRLDALAQLNRLRQEIQQNHGTITDNLVAEVRKEREAQIEETLKDSL